MANHAAVVAFQPDGPDEVVESYHGCHAVTSDAFGDRAVMIDGRLIKGAAFGFDSRPRDGEAEEFAA